MPAPTVAARAATSPSVTSPRHAERQRDAATPITRACPCSTPSPPARTAGPTCRSAIVAVRGGRGRFRPIPRMAGACQALQQLDLARRSLVDQGRRKRMPHDALFATAVAELGHVDVLINN